MRRAIWYILFTLCALLVGVFFFYPLHRMAGGMFVHTKAGVLVAEYPANLVSLMARRHAVYASYGEIPTCLRQGIVSVEDKRFFSHAGIDPFAAVRVLFEEFRNDHQDHGGSTITQQLARAILRIPRAQPGVVATAHSELDIWQAALILEHDYSKEKILELYLNSVYFGRGAYGAAAAAQAYFGKPLASLDTGECLYLAGLPQAPTLFGEDPSGSYAHDRYVHVIGTMRRNGYLTAEEASTLAGEQLFAK